MVVDGGREGVCEVVHACDEEKRYGGGDNYNGVEV